MIGDASVVALSEATHAAVEPLQFRNRVLQYLVEHQGFTAIAIESGLVEGRVVHDYVRGGQGDLSEVLSRGIGWGFDSLPQNRALVSWLREYNANPHHTRKVNFYGFDVPGSPGSPSARRGHDTALNEVLNGLVEVDGPACDGLRARLQPFMNRLSFAMQSDGDDSGYGTLIQDERDALTGIINDIVTLLEHHADKYTQVAGVSAYQWAHQAAIGARQMDAWLREMPVGGRFANRNDMLRCFAAATNIRDRAQAENLEWILRQEGESGKILVFAARYHLSSTPLKATFVSSGETHEQIPAGSYLRKRLGESLVTICHLIGEGQAGAGDDREDFPRAPPDSIDGLAAELGTPLFLLDLRTAPAPVSEWLNGEQRRLTAGGQTLQLPVAKAFDILFYTEVITPSC